MTHSLSAAMSDSRVEGVRRAAKALLRRPLLRAHGATADDFVLVRRHASELREWFDRNTGWRLLIDSEVARLTKTADSAGDATYPARDVRSKQPFSRRRYVLTCLALAALERTDTQITLGRLAEQVVITAGAAELVDAGILFRLDTREDRLDLVSVVRLLLDLGVLSRVAGEEESFLKDSGDVLYDVERRVLSVLLTTKRGPSTVDAEDLSSRLAAITEEFLLDSDDLRNRAIRQRLTQRLLDEPVVYYDELDEAELAYLTGQRSAITRRITELTGLVAEVRAEGIAMVDPNDDLTDVRMPETGTDGHVTLLLADFLTSQPIGEPTKLEVLHEQVRRFAGEHKAYWRKNAGDPGAEVELVRTALDRLEALRLVRRDADGVSARPALARYDLDAPTIRESATTTQEAP